MHHGLSLNALSDALVILGAAGIVIPAFARLRVSPVIGFILVGIAVGPHGLGALVDEHPWLFYVTITDEAAIAPYAEFGIILLLFSIGLELSFRRLWALRAKVFGIGAGELIFGGLAIAAALMLFGEGWLSALGLGFALTLSSTALVLPISGTTGRVGQNAFSMLLFEDLAIVPIIFVLGAMAPGMMAADPFADLVTLVVQSVAMIAALALIGWFALPQLFAQAARAKNPELFLAASLLVVILASLATASVGLSPIVGALLAGLMIAETEYHNEVEAIINPFKGLALGVFLITVGMGVDLSQIIREWPTILAAVAGILGIKVVVTFLLLRAGRVRKGTAAEVAILMASPSETTLIVLGAAVTAGVVSAEDAAFWQIITAIGLTITPLLAKIGHGIARRIDMASTDELAIDDSRPLVLIVGFGRVGQVIADMLDRHDRAYVAIEADIDSVARARAHGYNVRFGDAARPRFMDRFDHLTLSAIVLTMDDPVQQLQLTRLLRERFDDLPIVTRARDANDAAALYRAGANDSVPEALEGSLQMAEALLVDIGVAVGPVIASIHEHRAEVRRAIVERGELATQPRARLGGSKRAGSSSDSSMGVEG
jgi:CPA2 family monovalent cation:H+ antiporter-2